MDSYKGSNINLVKLHNLQVILQILLHDRSISRVELAQKTRLSNATISNLITELRQQGIVVEESANGAENGASRPVGRPKTAIRIEPNARCVIGVHIGIGIFRVAVVNLMGEIQANQIEHFQVTTPANEVLEHIARTVEAVIASSRLERSRILGVGVGASGLVNFRDGVNILAPNLNWHNVPLRDLLQNRLMLKVVVDNNVRAMAIGEKYFGAGVDVDSLVFVYGRTGLGAGLIFKGEVFRGSTTGAGEIGHTVIQHEGGLACRCGNTGCLETLVSEPAILREAEQIIHLNPRGIYAQITRSETEMNPLEKIFSAARNGDPQVKHLLDERARYLGVAVAGLVNLINPQMILFGGIFAQGKDLLLDPIIQTVRHNAFGGLGDNVSMAATSFGWRAGVIGAASLALMCFFYQLSDSEIW